MSINHDDVTRAARTMIAVEPPQDLEARIKRRLDAVTPAPTVRRWPWVAGLATAAALLALLVVQGPTWSRVQGSLDVPQSAVRGPQSAVQLPVSPSSHQPISSSAHLPLSPSPQLPSSAAIRLPAYRTISESELEWMARRVPALDLIDPIQPEPVWITPLTMTPLMTSPMYGDPDEGRQ